MLALTPNSRRELRARAHGLKPVVWIGAAGLSDNVVNELDQRLKSHELIKIKVASDDWEIRNALLEEICQRLKAVPVQHIGKMLVIYRPEPEISAITTPDSRAARKEEKPRRSKEEKRSRTSYRSRRASSRAPTA